MQVVDVFTAKDLRNRSNELLEGTAAGNIAVITKHGKPALLAIPFDSKLLNYGAHQAMAFNYFQVDTTRCNRPLASATWR